MNFAEASNVPPSLAEGQIIDELAATNSNDIQSANEALNKDIVELQVHEAALAHLEETIANTRSIFGIHLAQIERLLVDKENLTRLGCAIGERGTTLTDIAEDFYLKLGHNPPCFHASQIEMSLTTLNAHLMIVKEICDMLQAQMKRLLEERDRQQVTVTTKSGLIRHQKNHISGLEQVQLSLLRQYRPQFRIPPEIWSMIFEDCVQQVVDDFLADPGRERMIYMPLRLAHVCSLWRRTIIGTSRAWTTIGIPYSLEGQQMNLEPIRNLLNLSDPQLGRRFISCKCPTLFYWIPGNQRVDDRVHLHIITPVTCRQLQQEPDYLRIEQGYSYPKAITFQGRRGAHLGSQYGGRVSLPEAGIVTHLKIDEELLARMSGPMREWDADLGSRYSFHHLSIMLQDSHNTLEKLNIRSIFSNWYPLDTTITLPNLKFLGLVLHPNVELRRFGAIRLEEVSLYDPKIEDCLNNCLEGMDVLFNPVFTLNVIEWGQQSQVDMVQYEGLLEMILGKMPRLQNLRFIGCIVDDTVLARLLQGRQNIAVTVGWWSGMTQRHCDALSRAVRHLTLVL
ncbi:hypothetical protein FRC19_004152 [Serendipita sp. 401]|nr:hypothetical protein FRC19_004152 [Serendipita sp. 401]